MNLVVVESPTKAKMLTKFLGEGFRVEATMGHVRDLPEKKLGVKISRANGSFLIETQYELVENRKVRMEELKHIASSASSVILATDPDREGEAIAWHTAALLRGEQSATSNQQSAISRVVFHQITKDAILEAMGHPRQIDTRLVDAQQARRVLDRVVGYKLSPMLWKKIRRGLSAGRVQSVAVRLVVDREREIESFVPIEYWEILVEVSPAKRDSANFIVKLIEVEGKKADLSKKEQVEPIVRDLEVAAYSVSDVEKKEVHRHPYPPFTTSTLQQAASRLFHWSGKKTMSVAQQLYEHGYITYHRTDSFSLDPGAVAQARELVVAKFGPIYVAPRPNIFRTKSALAQEAHEAIRVTNLADADRLSEIERDIGAMGREAVRLYDLIWKRFIACQMTDQVFDQTTISVEAQGQRRYLLSARGQVEKFDGWKKAYQAQSSKIPASPAGGKVQIFVNTAGEEQRLPEIEKGEKLRLLSVSPKQNFTQPPPRYSEALLIKALEARGIGRPSTYAPIISTIQERGYVEKREGKFFPLPVGMVVNDFLVEYFREIVDDDFTRGMEESLDSIARGQKEWSDVVGAFWFPFADRLHRVEEDAARKKVPVEETGEACPECQQGKQVIRSGRFGKFLSCSRFPECKWTATYLEKSGMKCPECHEGDVIVRRTKKGKRFYGCSRYPDCKWASWRKPK